MRALRTGVLLLCGLRALFFCVAPSEFLEVVLCPPCGPFVFCALQWVLSFTPAGPEFYACGPLVLFLFYTLY